MEILEYSAEHTGSCTGWSSGWTWISALLLAAVNEPISLLVASGVLCVCMSML